MDEQESHRLQELDKMKRLAWALSLAGFIPFLACTLIVVILGLENPLADPAIAIFRNYSVIILSFLGGIRWGHALLRESDDDATFDDHRIDVAPTK